VSLLSLATAACSGAAVAALFAGLQSLPERKGGRGTRHQYGFALRGLCLGAALLLAGGASTWGVAAASGALLAYITRRYCRRLRQQRIEEQLPGWLQSLTQALRANPNLLAAFDSSAAVVSPPLRDELREVMRDHRLGRSLGSALDGWGQRCPSSTIAAVITTLKVGRQSGGSLVTTLSRAAETLRENARLEGVLRTKTAEGRLQSLVISILPAPTAVIVDWLRPDYFDPLLRGPLGWGILMLFGLLWAGAVVLTHRILAVDF
jgi:tight adherence protein B